MPVYEFTPADPEAGVPARLALLGGDPEQIHTIKSEFAVAAIRAAYQGFNDGASIEESEEKIAALRGVVATIREADPTNWPLDIVAPFIAERDTDVVVNEDYIHAYKYGGWLEGQTLEVFSERVDPEALMGDTDDQFAADTLRARGFSYYGLAIEPGRPEPSLANVDHMCHLSFGTASGDFASDYTPVVTVLSKSHPIRLAIEAKQASADDVTLKDLPD